MRHSFDLFFKHHLKRNFMYTSLLGKPFLLNQNFYNTNANLPFKTTLLCITLQAVGLSQFTHQYNQLLTGCLHFDPCCEIAYRFYNSRVMNELRQAHTKPTFSIRGTLLYHCVGSLLFNIEFTDQSAVFKQMSLSIGPDVLCIYSVY